MTLLLRAAAGVAGRVIGTTLAYGLTVLWPVRLLTFFNEPADRQWAAAASRKPVHICPHSLSQCARACRCESS